MRPRRRILVTGAAGFLGWNLTRELRRRHPDAEILGLDSLWTGVRRSEEFCTMLEGRVEWARPFWDSSFDEVWHLASPASPVHYQARPSDTISANVIGMMNCLRWVMPNGMLFFTSTSEVYGDPLVDPQPESYKGSVSCTGPRACYDESKRLCETMLLAALREGRPLQAKIVRLFNAYGPGTLENDGRAMSNFICQALRGQDITVMGDGMQTRSFTYVDDVILGLMCMAYHADDFVGPVNIGIGTETSVLDIAHAVRDLVMPIDGSMLRSRIVHIDPATDDPQQRRPDLSLCRERLGWVATTSYRDGIVLTADYFRRLMGEEQR